MENSLVLMVASLLIGSAACLCIDEVFNHVEEILAAAALRA
jgi:hypothetical protein